MLTKQTSYLLVVIALLIAGCAVGPRSVDIDKSPQDAVKPDMSAAITALKGGDALLAEAILRQLTLSHPQAVLPWVNVGLINFRRGDFGAARKAAETALALNSEIATTHYLLALVTHQQGDALKAQQHYLAAIAMDDNHTLTHYNLALLYDTYFQDIEKAVHHYHRYLALLEGDDEETQSWVRELESQLQSGETDEE